MGWFRLSEQEEKFWERINVGNQIDVMAEAHMSVVYQSEVIHIDNRLLEISVPRKGGTFLDANVFPRLVIHVYTDYGIFKFSTSVAAQHNQTRGSIAVAKPKKIEHIQRRQFFRLSVELPVQYAEGSMAADSVNPVTYTGMTRDVSEGGLLLVTSTIHPAGALLKVLINLSTNSWISAVAQVRRQKKLGLTEKLMTSLQFVKISDKDRDSVRRFVLTHTFKRKS